MIASIIAAIIVLGIIVTLLGIIVAGVKYIIEEYLHHTEHTRFSVYSFLSKTCFFSFAIL